MQPFGRGRRPTGMTELRLALRSLGRARVFTAVVVVSLALGIGANGAMFGLADQVLLRLLPVHNPRELVLLRIDGGRFGSNSGDGVHTFSHPLYLALRDRNTVLAGLTGELVQPASLVGDDRNESISVGMVAGNYFDVLGVRPHRGRLLVPDDDRVRNGHPVVVLQYHFWRNRFAGSDAVVGSTIRLNGTPFTVIGVADERFEGTDTGLPTEAWVPVTMKPTITPTWDELDNERYSWFYLFGRLKPGVTLDAAQASLRVLYRQRQDEELQGQYFQQFPDERERFSKQSFVLEPASRGRSALRSRFEQPLVVLQGLVGLVLLIACANVASLLLARAAARRKEIAIRAALGAPRGRLVRQLLLESLILAGAGGVAGLAVSTWLGRTLVGFLPYDTADLSLTTAPDVRILAFTLGVTLLAALVFGVVPALSGSNVSPGLTLKDETVASGHGHVRLRKTLIGLQVTLSTVLLVGALLFVRTLQNLRSVDLGFRTDDVVTFAVEPATVYDEGRKRQVFRALVERLAGVPGVKAVGASRTRLLTGGRWDSGITIPGVGRVNDENPWSYFNAVTPGYFEALGIPVKAGRDFTWDDWGSARERCLVNEALVSEYLNGQIPVGRMMGQGRGVTPDMEIIGVLANAHYENVRGTIPRQTFVSLGGARMRTVAWVHVHARTDRDPRQVMPLLRREAQRVDPNFVITGMRTLRDHLDRRLSAERMLFFLSTLFALLATLLAVVGLYGVLEFVVTRRTREIGIRMALGAERGRVVRLVLRETVALVGFGIAAGVATAVAGARVVESQLFGVEARDPLVFAASAAVLLAACLAAGAGPAWRAARIDPVRALRHD
jgi:predicted permease